MKFNKIFLISILLLFVSLSTISAEDINNEDISVNGVDDSISDIQTPNTVNEISNNNINTYDDVDLDQNSSEDSDSENNGNNSQDSLDDNNTNDSINSSDNITDDKGNITDNSTSDENNTTKEPLPTDIVVEDVENRYHLNQSYSVDLNSNSTVLAGQNITFLLDGKIIGIGITDENGTAYLNYDFMPGDYNVTVMFNGTSEYAASTAIFNVKILDNTTIIADDLIKYFRNASRYYATFLNEEGMPLANTNVTFSVNGKSYTVETDENGTASLGINLDPGVYQITLTNPNTNQTLNYNITILSTIQGDDLVKYFRNASRYYATFLNEDGAPLAHQNVTFNINGVIYYKETNENGTADLGINLLPGEYVITATNLFNNQQFSNNITVLSTINTTDVVKYFRNGTQFLAKVVDSNGNIVRGVNVTFNINGKFYTKQTDENGVAILNINLNPGNYTITTYNALTNQSIGNTVEVLPTLAAENLTKTYGQDGSYVVRFVDGQGNPMANQIVTFNIHGRFYTRTTDENGTASLAINLYPGTYIISAYCNDASISNTIVVNKLSAKISLLTSSIMSGQSIKYSFVNEATGEPIVGLRAILYYMVNGNFERGWYVTTDSSGVASLRVTADTGSYMFAAVIQNNPLYGDIMTINSISIKA